MTNHSLALLCAILSGGAVVYLDGERRRLSLSALHKTSLIVLLDALSPAAAFAYAIFVLGNSAGNSTGTAVNRALEILMGAGIFVHLWLEGKRANQIQRPSGIVLGEFLILAGLARAISHVIANELPMIDVWSIGGVIAGSLWTGWIVARFLKKSEEHHIIERLDRQGEVQQPEWAPRTAECPHPERWTMFDSMSAEVEVLEFLKHVVLTLKPELIVETGTFVGQSTIKMAEGLEANRLGRIVTCEFDPLVFAKAKQQIEASAVSHRIECRNQSSLELKVEGKIDLFFSDSESTIREQEIRNFLPQISPQGLILMHDTSSHFKVAREAAFRLESEGLISMVVLPTPRGLMIGQKRAGRT